MRNNSWTPMHLLQISKKNTDILFGANYFGINTRHFARHLSIPCFVITFVFVAIFASSLSIVPCGL